MSFVHTRQTEEGLADKPPIIGHVLDMDLDQIIVSAGRHLAFQ